MGNGAKKNLGQSSVHLGGRPHRFFQVDGVISVVFAGGGGEDFPGGKPGPPNARGNRP